MLKFLKNFFYIFLVLAISKDAHAFDLKALTDKIQKDVGGKLNVPQNNSGSNPLGNMLKGLNQKNAGINMQNTKKGTPNNSSSKKLAGNLCVSNIPQTVKNLPKADVALIHTKYILRFYLSMAY